MTVEGLFRILLDDEEIMLYSRKTNKCIWEGVVKDIPNCFFDNLVSNLYSLNGSSDSYLVINIIE